MSICFNSIQVTAPETTANRLLAKAFESSDFDDWGMSPQAFSFLPFVADKSDQDLQRALESIWTNWIERHWQKPDQVLTIEFESENTPPIAAVNAMIEWLQQQKLIFDLRYQYRRENESWQGELTAHSTH
ncbi:hypothetical protein HBA55_33425 [Pseudomaricurvus alkylphenolicus]|jgi:hypothetical protein|uniref:hypothetical protein n=1 Tax=Pseudomaricurvus alkylphenolicus TaxID=1306991 RepID=UPI001423DCCA|nr:hypothetical protein [Pseudomaricurvus alkylphenolicus]NIB44537.1 hypothetical protein [Pseudomaricurvus alkylphenolicus]